jgi:hypothetical protein
MGIYWLKPELEDLCLYYLSRRSTKDQVELAEDGTAKNSSGVIELSQKLKEAGIQAS